MDALPPPLAFFLLLFSGWVNRVGLELAIFALIPGLGNVAERPASDLR